MPKPSWWVFLRVRDDGWSSEFQSVDLLLRHLSRKSRSVGSRSSYCYILFKLCAFASLNPDEFVLMSREKPNDAASRIQDLADRYNNQGSTRYANQIIHIATTFLKVNKIELTLLSYSQPARSRRHPEYIPTLLEALKMADMAKSLRDRLAILVLIYTGLRNSTLRSLVYDESYPDPLLQEHTIKSELERGEEYLVIMVHEIMKKRIPDACKGRVFYYVFLPKKVTECLRLHLCEMGRKYGAISSDRPIFVTENRRIPLKERLRTPIAEHTLQDVVKSAARRAGIKNWRYVYPHCLRKTYESFLRNQPDDLRLDEKEREFLFGHILPGSQDTYFDKTKIDEMRAKYAKLIFEPAVSIEKEERVIREGELPTYLQDGWHFEATLASGSVVISRMSAIKKTAKTETTTARVPNLDARVEKRSDLQVGRLELFAPNNQLIETDTNTEGKAPKSESENLCPQHTIISTSENPQSTKDALPSCENDKEEKKQIAAFTGESQTTTTQKSLLDFTA